MTAIVVHPGRWEQRRLQRTVRKTREAGLRTRALIILHAAAGKSSGHIAEAIGYDPSAVLKVMHRFLAEGEEVIPAVSGEKGEKRLEVEAVGDDRELLEPERKGPRAEEPPGGEDGQPIPLVVPEAAVLEKLLRRLQDRPGLRGAHPPLHEALLPFAEKVLEADRILPRVSRADGGHEERDARPLPNLRQFRQFIFPEQIQLATPSRT